MNSSKMTSYIIDKPHFLNFCHSLYDNIHGKEKINAIFDVPENQLSIIMEIYCRNFMSRIIKISNFINENTEIKDNLASSFYVNAFQHYLKI